MNRAAGEADSPLLGTGSVWKIFSTVYNILSHRYLKIQENSLVRKLTALQTTSLLHILGR
jgi:hypothetical protein